MGEIYLSVTINEIYSNNTLSIKEKIEIIKNDFKPKKLYRYLSLDKQYNWDAIKNNYVWIDEFSKFNDPFECFTLPQYNDVKCLEFLEPWEIFSTDFQKSELSSRVKSGEGVIDVLKDIISKITDNEKQNFAEAKMYECFKSINQYDIDISKTIKDMFNDFLYIGCFTENYDSILMWSHYGNSHCGVCIEYDTDLIPDCLLFPVIYTDKCIPYYKVLDDNLIPQILLMKSTCWKYEQEWRIIDSKKSDHKFYLKPSSIFIGAGMYNGNHNQWLQNIQKIAIYNKIPLNVMYMSTSGYKLGSINIIDINNK